MLTLVLHTSDRIPELLNGSRDVQHIAGYDIILWNVCASGIVIWIAHLQYMQSSSMSSKKRNLSGSFNAAGTSSGGGSGSRPSSAKEGRPTSLGTGRSSARSATSVVRCVQFICLFMFLCVLSLSVSEAYLERFHTRKRLWFMCYF